MDKRYQVFISSTYADLLEERKKVIQALLELEYIPAGMELFPSASEDQWTVIKKVIDDCDYYMVIIAGRYGSIGPNGKSYTEMEYRYALNAGKPIIGFLHRKPGDLAASRCEPSEDGKAKLNNFRALVQEKLCRFWDSPADLVNQVSSSLIMLTKRNPGIGWVRSDLLRDDITKTEKLGLQRPGWVQTIPVNGPPEQENQLAASGGASSVALPAEFDTENYQKKTGESFVTEREYKLASPANKQFKFTTIMEATWIIQRLTDICRTLGVELQEPFTREIVDTYYDDERRTLAQRGQLVRKRVEQNIVKLQCKGQEQIVKQELRRPENEMAWDSAIEQELECGRIPEAMKSLFWKMGVHLGPIGVPFSPVLAVHNQRTVIALKTSDGNYTFCYDKYYYQSGSDFSEYFSEIEIEVESETLDDAPDYKLQQVLESLKLLTEYEFQVTSKYKRGIEWLRKQHESTEIWMLIFEILGLDSVMPPVQKQMLQTLSHFLKLGLQAFGYDISLVVQVPSPDGFTIYIEQLPECILAALRQAREQIQAVYNPGHAEYEFDFRVAIDRCRVIRYSGISEDLVLSSIGFSELKRQLVDVPGGSFVYCSEAPQQL